MTEPQKDHNRYCNVAVCCANIDGICGASLELCKTHSIIALQSGSQWTDENVLKQIEDAYDRGIVAAEATIDMQKHDETIRNQTLDIIKQHMINTYNYPDIEDWLIEEIMSYLESLSTLSTQEQP